MKHAEHCGAFSNPQLNHTGLLKARLLKHEDVLEIVAERLEIVLAGEVAVRTRPVRDRLDDTTDQLLHAPLALRRAELPAEVLRDDDVGGLLRPELGDFDVTLLEHHFAALVADNGRTEFPLDLVERIDAGLVKNRGKVKPGAAAAFLVRPSAGSGRPETVGPDALAVPPPSTVCWLPLAAW